MILLYTLLRLTQTQLKNCKLTNIEKTKKMSVSHTDAFQIAQTGLIISRYDNLQRKVRTLYNNTVATLIKNHTQVQTALANYYDKQYQTAKDGSIQQEIIKQKVHVLHKLSLKYGSYFITVHQFSVTIQRFLGIFMENHLKAQMKIQTKTPLPRLQDLHMCNFSKMVKDSLFLTNHHFQNQSATNNRNTSGNFNLGKKKKHATQKNIAAAIQNKNKNKNNNNK